MTKRKRGDPTADGLILSVTEGGQSITSEGSLVQVARAKIEGTVVDWLVESDIEMKTLTVANSEHPSPWISQI